MKKLFKTQCDRIPIDPAILAAIGHRFIAKKTKKMNKHADVRVWGHTMLCTYQMFFHDPFSSAPTLGIVTHEFIIIPNYGGTLKMKKSTMGTKSQHVLHQNVFTWPKSLHFDKLSGQSQSCGVTGRGMVGLTTSRRYYKYFTVPVRGVIFSKKSEKISSH